jgi:hypothetical protein
MSYAIDQGKDEGEINEQLFTYEYKGNGDVDVQPTAFLLSLSDDEQKKALIDAIGIFERELRETSDLVMRAKFNLCIKFSNYLLDTQDSWNKANGEKGQIK